MTINYMFGRLHAICLGFPTPDKKMQNGGKEEDTRKESYSHFLTETLKGFLAYLKFSKQSLQKSFL